MRHICGVGRGRFSQPNWIWRGGDGFFCTARAEFGAAILVFGVAEFLLFARCSRDQPSSPYSARRPGRDWPPISPGWRRIGGITRKIPHIVKIGLVEQGCYCISGRPHSARLPQSLEVSVIIDKVVLFRVLFANLSNLFRTNRRLGGFRKTRRYARDGGKRCVLHISRNKGSPWVGSTVEAETSRKHPYFLNKRAFSRPDGDTAIPH